MATPLTAAGAYASIAKLTSGVGVGAGVATSDKGAGSFTDVLKHALESVKEAGHKADLQTQSAIRGSGNMVDVVTAVAETETAIDAVVAVRDKVIAAYEDILKMPI